MLSQIQLCCFFDCWQTIDFMRIIIFITHLGSHSERMEKWKRVGGTREKRGAAGGFVCKATALAHCLCSVFWLRITHDLSLFITGSERHALAARPLDGRPLGSAPTAPLLHRRNPWHAQDRNNWNTREFSLISLLIFTKQFDLLSGNLWTAGPRERK